MESRPCFKLFGVQIPVPETRAAPVLIFRKRLFESDVRGGLTRLTMPYNQLMAKTTHFLRDHEDRLLQSRDGRGRLLKIPVQVIDPREGSHNLTLSRWVYNKPPRSRLELVSRRSGGRKRSDRPSWSYALCGGWKRLVESSGLKKGDLVEVWAFRRGTDDGGLGFLIKKLGREPVADCGLAQDGCKKMRTDANVVKTELSA